MTVEAIEITQGTRENLKEYCILLKMNFLPKNKLWKSINQKIRKEVLKINKWLPI